MLTSGFVFNIDENATVSESFIASGTTLNPGDRVSYDIESTASQIEKISELDNSLARRLRLGR